jgi:hypothetical protein
MHLCVCFEGICVVDRMTYVEQFSVSSGTVRPLLRTSSMTHKKRVLLSLTLPGAVVQPLALEPVALEPTAADTSNV